MSGTTQVKPIQHIFYFQDALLVIIVSQAVTGNQCQDSQSECQKMCRGLCAQQWSNWKAVATLHKHLQNFKQTVNFALTLIVFHLIPIWLLLVDFRDC